MTVADILKRQDHSDGSATMLLGTDSDAFAQRLKQASNGHQVTETPTPEGEGQSSHDRDGGGPVTRFTNAFAPLGLGTLEYVGLSGHEIADAIQMRVTELYRNEFPVIQPRFERRCVDCGAEFEERHEECPQCGGETREPDADERQRFETMLERVNREGQSFRELAKGLEFDQGFLGCPVLVIRYDYTIAGRDSPVSRRGEVIDRDPVELVKGDPKRIVPVVDENRRIGGYWWACPRCRGEPGYEPSRKRDHCADCGARLKEVYFAEYGERRTSEDVTTYYFEDEILTFPWYFPRLNGLDGLTPVHHVWLKQVIIEYMDSYAGSFYDPESDRLPNQFIVLHTTNPDAWEARLDQARENAEEDRYDSPIFANEYSPQDASTPEVQVVDAMPDELLGQNETLKDTLKKDIRQAFNIADVFDSDLDEAGGLNNEGLQLEVTDRSIATQMHDYATGWLDELAKRLGVDDWTLGFIPATGPDAEDLLAEVKAGKLAEESGLDARMVGGQAEVADGEFDVPEPAPDEGGFGGGPGVPMAEDGSEGGDGSSHDYGPELKLKQAAKNDLETACDVLFEAHQHLIWPDLVEQRAEEPFWDRDEEMPQFVEAAIREALRGGAISAISEHLPVGTTRADVRSFFEDQLRQPQGWSLRSLTQNYAQRFGVSEDEAVTAVRTQTSNILNEARAEGYRAQGDVDDREFKWLGPSDARTTEACERLKAETNPDYGGEPVTLDELRQLVTEVRRDAFPEFRGADWTVHWNERHTYVEHFD